MPTLMASRVGYYYLFLAVLMLALLVLIALMPIFSAQADFGANWTATYYNSTDLTGAVAYTETLPNGININWGTGSPNASVHNDNFSARFTSVQLFNAGTYEFVASSDDGVRVFIGWPYADQSADAASADPGGRAVRHSDSRDDAAGTASALSGRSGGRACQARADLSGRRS